MIEWIFFDLGSTLLDEEVAYSYYIDKCVKKLESLDIEVSSDSYKKKMVEYAHKSLDPIRATWQYLAPTEPRPLWTNEGVSLYPETIDALEKLSQNYQLGIIANQSATVRALLEEWELSLTFNLLSSLKKLDYLSQIRLFSNLYCKKQTPQQIELSMLGIGTIMTLYQLNRWV